LSSTTSTLAIAGSGVITAPPYLIFTTACVAVSTATGPAKHLPELQLRSRTVAQLPDLALRVGDHDMIVELVAQLLGRKRRGLGMRHRQ
jgi:hypothetical protein